MIYLSTNLFMKTYSILTCILTLFVGFLFSNTVAGAVNNPSDTIEIKQKFGEYQFYEDGKLLNMARLKSALSGDKQAFSEFKSARNAKGIASVLAAAGGALIGWPIGAAIGGGDPEWAMLGAGVALVGVSIPFIIKANKKFRNAVDLYNSNPENLSYKPAVEFRLGATGKGFGLVMNF